jgi:hypothetical protein
MYCAVLRRKATRELLVWKLRDARRFKRQYRKYKEDGIELEVLEKGITEDRAERLVRRGESIEYRTSRGAVYSGETYSFRRRDHWLDTAEAKLPLVRILA